MKARTYHGSTIYPCEWASGQHKGKWIVQTFHQTGMPYADSECPHFHTLADAKRHIDEWARIPA